MFDVEKGCLGQSSQRTLGIEFTKKCVIDQLFFLLPKFLLEINIKILKFKTELFSEAFSRQTKQNVKNHNHFFYLLPHMIDLLMQKKDLQKKSFYLSKNRALYQQRAMMIWDGWGLLWILLYKQWAALPLWSTTLG